MANTRSSDNKDQSQKKAQSVLSREIGEIFKRQGLSLTLSLTRVQSTPTFSNLSATSTPAAISRTSSPSPSVSSISSTTTPNISRTPTPSPTARSYVKSLAAQQQIKANSEKAAELLADLLKWIENEVIGQEVLSSKKISLTREFQTIQECLLMSIIKKSLAIHSTLAQLNYFANNTKI